MINFAKEYTKDLSSEDKDLLLDALLNNLSIDHVETSPEMMEVKFNITLRKMYDSKEGAWIRNSEIEKQNDLLIDFARRLLTK